MSRSVMLHHGRACAPCLATACGKTSQGVVILEWEDVGTTSYTVEVDEDELFGSPTEYPLEAGPSKIVTGLSVGETYHWRVKACDAVCSDWSDPPRSFHTEEAPGMS